MIKSAVEWLWDISQVRELMAKDFQYAIELEKKENHIVDTNEMIISDEEIKRKIEKEIKKRYETTQNDAGFRDGWFLAIEWYREKLKNK